jgi:hypothetical protein
VAVAGKSVVVSMIVSMVMLVISRMIMITRFVRCMIVRLGHWLSYQPDMTGSQAALQEDGQED